MSHLYRKTVKGAAEIATRQHQLPSRLRQLLILVDGQRRTRELAKLVPDHDAQILATLVSQGFIEEVLKPKAPPRGLKPARAEFAAAPPWPSILHALLSPAPPPEPPPAPTPEFLARRRRVVQALHETLGEQARALAVFMENANNDQQLKPLLARAVARVATVRGLGVAEAFVERWVAARPLSAFLRPAAAGARSSGRRSSQRPGAR